MLSFKEVNHIIFRRLFMDKRIEENVRVKNSITHAFFSLLEKKNIDSITVSEITKLADVSRMSYYRNFNTKFEIIEYFFSRILNEMLETLDVDFNFWTLEYGYAFFNIMKKYKHQILLLDSLGFSGAILNFFNHANEEFAGDMPSNSIERYRLYYIAGAAYNGLIQWLKDDCKENISDMTASLSDFIDINSKTSESYSPIK
jgi:AcrR family transcriptional regulator